MVTRFRDGSRWRIGTDAEVAWIVEGTSMSRTIPAAIPPVFEAYATLVLPPAGQGHCEHDRAVLALLREQSAGQPWWLGYLDTGADDIVFPDAPKVTLYSGWHYVLVEAGPDQAATWRQSGDWSFWTRALPNLMFPADRSLAGVDAVGRRLDLHLRSGPARDQVPPPPSSPGESGRAWPRSPTAPGPN